MIRSVVAILILASVAYSRMAYRLADGFDYVLTAPLQTTFTCDGLKYGYYADTENNCEVFHVCLPIADDIGALADTEHFSFFCNNQTVFDQESLTCAHRDYAFPCSEARTLYEISNAEIGIDPVKKDDTK